MSSATTNTNFYVQIPRDERWCIIMDNWVIEAAPINPKDETLLEHQKTDEYVYEFLKVIAPKKYLVAVVPKDKWVKCDGPSRPLDFKSYVALYHSIEPSRPLPLGWKMK